jgi:hypothetical protein
MNTLAKPEWLLTNVPSGNNHLKIIERIKKRRFVLFVWKLCARINWNASTKELPPSCFYDLAAPGIALFVLLTSIMLPNPTQWNQD